MIVSDPVEYPPQLSAPLRDLLQRLLCKNPEYRIGLDGIKAHPWFSLHDYKALVEAAYVEVGHLYSTRPAPPGLLDAEIVAKLAEMGFATALLAQAVLQGADNEVTVVYNILRREALTKRMGNIAARVARREARLLGPPEKMPPDGTLGEGEGGGSRRQSRPSHTLAAGILPARSTLDDQHEMHIDMEFHGECDDIAV
jgi:hypothetical protein